MRERHEQEPSSKNANQISEKKFFELCEGDLVYVCYSDSDESSLHFVSYVDEEDIDQPIEVAEVGADRECWPTIEEVYLLPTQATLMDQYDAEEAFGMFMIRHFSQKLLGRKIKSR